MFLFQLTMANSSKNETQEKSKNGSHDNDFSRNKIMMAQFECYQKISKDTNNNQPGSIKLNFFSLDFMP